MNRRQKIAKAARVAAHNTGADTPNGRSTPQVLPERPRRGPVLHKPSAAKVRRLIARASRKANRA